MSVLLFLLPLGLIFDLVGYLPPPARLFLIYGLLALPLCLKPSRQSAWLGLALAVVMVLRAALPVPAVVEMMVFLALHQAIWSVMAPIPRPLRVGVIAYAFLYLWLFVSPLGHPVLEALTAMGNGILQSVTKETFNLGPTYQNIGALLLFLTLSVFGWGDSKLAPWRTACLVVVAVLLNAVAAAVLIHKVNFDASFAWNFKFTEAEFGYHQLGEKLLDLAVLYFPACLFLAQLLAYLLLHCSFSGASNANAAFPQWDTLKSEWTWGKRQLAVAGWVVLTVLVLVPPTAWRSPDKCDLIFVDSDPRFPDRCIVSYTKPDDTRYGEAAGGMFGMFPEYARLFGCKTAVVKDIPATLDPRQTLVLTNLGGDFGADVRKRIWEFVAKGGKLWLLGDHTFIKDEKPPLTAAGIPQPPGTPPKKGINHLNEMLEPTHIYFNNDSTEFFPQGWFNSYRFPQGTPFAALTDDDENRPGVLVGASLRLGIPAEPLLFGRFGYADLGLEIPKGEQGYLGDFKFEANERLGDLVLIAGERYGKGKVLVYGDTTSFFNNNLGRSFEILRASLAYLGESNAWLMPASAPGRALAALLVLAIAAGAFVWRAAPVAAAALLGATLVSTLGHGTGGLPPFDKEFTRDRVAVIDYSHQPNASKHAAMDSGLHGVSINFMRHGLLPITANRWDPDTLDLARYVILNAPRRSITHGETSDLMRFMRRGGIVILGCGYQDAPACHELLEPLGLSIGSVPYGRFFDCPAFGQPVSFMSAWPLDKVPDGAKVLCATPDKLPLMVSVPVGKGQLILIGDSEFLHNRNLEGAKNHDPQNTAFIKNLLDFTAR